MVAPVKIHGLGSDKRLSIELATLGPGEMASQVRVLAVLKEDLGLVPGSHMGAQP